MASNKSIRQQTRILVVDDDAGQRSLLESFLGGQGFDIVSAASGEEALERLGAEPFAMVVSDVRMSGISGLDTLHRIREQGITLPVLIMAGISPFISSPWRACRAISMIFT